MKGIILAGGSGSRLFPATLAVSKQLLPVFDKPMIYYPLSLLMLAGITDILLISTPEDLPRFTKLFQDGSHLGLSISYAEQKNPNGLAEAFIIGKHFIGRDSVCLILGDNIFYGHDLSTIMKESSLHKEGGLIFGYRVQDPSRYGVVEFDADFRVVGIEEKPKNPKSSFAVPGLYFYDSSVVEIAKNLSPSPRGELEITDVNRVYLQNKKLAVKIMGRGFAWLDMGTHDSLQKASLFVQAIEERQGIKIACIEEIAYHMNYIDKKALSELSYRYGQSDYAKYLRQLSIS
jgi:glucose-1-phosphate thymidylyltransferase